METKNISYFNPPDLFAMKDLNARQFAEKENLSTKEYFDILENVLNDAQEVTFALNEFVKMRGDIDTYRRLDGIAATLKAINCETHAIGFYSLLGAYESGNWRLAAVHAEKLTNSFGKFISELNAARRVGDADVLINTLPDMSITLKEYISAQPKKEEPVQKKIILAIDDSPVVLKSVSSILRDEYKVYTLPKPTELEKVLRKLTPDLFLLDYNMPDITGFELIPIIRNFKGHEKTPIIFLTSVGTLDNLTAAITLGACDYTVKPFSPDVLRQKIAKHINGETDQ